MQEVRINLNREFVELHALLKLAGACDSGGAGKALIASGAVCVDGKTETRKSCKIRAGQSVQIGDLIIRVELPPMD